MRVISGRFKGRALVTPTTQSIRPTSDRLRETLFNVLTHRFQNSLENARVLDLFAGTGALGIEALSRGAKFCVFIDEGTEARALLRTNIENLGLTGDTRVFKRDATNLGDVGTLQAFDLVFCDPPYLKNNGEMALASLRDGKWLNPNALIVLEESKTATFLLPDGFEILDCREEGAGKIYFIRATNGG